MSEPDTTTERVALVAWHLAHGDGMTTANVAELTKLTSEGARLLMLRISRVLPIYRDEYGVWQVCALKELECAN